MRPKPVKDVKTFDGRQHEVDIKQTQKTVSAWGFVDGRMIEGWNSWDQMGLMTQIHARPGTVQLLPEN